MILSIKFKKKTFKELPLLFLLLLISGVARPGPSRARPDLIIDYHIMDITVLAVESACKTAKPRQRFMFIASILAKNFASYSRSSSFYDRNSPSHVRSRRPYVRGCGPKKFARASAHIQYLRPYLLYCSSYATAPHPPPHQSC